MPPKKINETPELKEKSPDYHGKCAYARLGPPYESKSLSIEIPFDEALKLSLALQSCLMSLNRLDRRSKAGKIMGLELSITTDTKAIKVIEKKMADQ